MEAASQPQEQQGGGELDEADCEFDTQTPDCNNEITPAQTLSPRRHSPNSNQGQVQAGQGPLYPAEDRKEIASRLKTSVKLCFNGNSSTMATGATSTPPCSLMWSVAHTPTVLNQLRGAHDEGFVHELFAECLEGPHQLRQVAAFRPLFAKWGSSEAQQ